MIKVQLLSFIHITCKFLVFLIKQLLKENVIQYKICEKFDEKLILIIATQSYYFHFLDKIIAN